MGSAGEGATATLAGSPRPAGAGSVWEQVRDAVSLGTYLPVLRPDLTWAALTTRRGQPYTMLADRPRVYLRLSTLDADLCRRMDGTRRVADLVVDYFHRTGRFGFDRVAALVALLRRSAFLRDPPKDIWEQLNQRLHPLDAPARTGRWEGTPLRLRLPLRGIDPFVTRFHDRVGRVVYTRPFLLGTVAVAILGLLAFAGKLRQGRDPFEPFASSHIAGLLLLVVGYYAAVFVHESAHALTCKHFGRRVDEGGFMLYYLVPAFYVNVTDAWLEPWYRRIAVFWAGPYAGFVVAGLSSILVWLLSDGSVIGMVLFKLAVSAYIANAFNLMPLLLLDGYWILEEWLETPGLRERALHFVRGPLWRQLVDRKPLSRREKFYAIFGSLCAVYSFLAVYTAFIYWGRRLKPIVVPLWVTPGTISKAVVAIIVSVVAVPLGIRLGRALWGYQAVVRQAPAAARKALRTIRVWDRLRLLERVGFLNGAPAASLERLAHAAQVRGVSAGAAVVRQGDRGDEFFVLAEGEAEVLVRERGDDRLAATLHPGDFFGEGALLGSGVRGATVRAVTSLRLLVIGQRTFWNEVAGMVAWEAQVRAALQERERLETVPLFSELGSRQLDLLAVKLGVQAYQRGAAIVRQGDVGDAFYILREGSAEVLARDGGRARRLGLLNPGDFFGEVALLRDIPRTATVRARTDASVWRLDRQDFHDLVGRYLGLEEQVAAVAAARVSH